MAENERPRFALQSGSFYRKHTIEELAMAQGCVLWRISSRCLEGGLLMRSTTGLRMPSQDGEGTISIPRSEAEPHYAAAAPRTSSP